MFYFHEILKKRGKFGMIWLAATIPKRLSKRDVLSVDVARSSNDIVEILTQFPTISGHKNVRFSLYLSSQLMFGLLSVHHMKAAILLEDLKNFVGRISTFQRDLCTNIDLVEPTSGFRVTFDEPDLGNAPIDFGSFSITGISPVHIPSYDYFIISTPRSDEEWQISRGLPDNYQRTATDTGDEFIARPEDITLHEDVPVQTEEAPVPPEEAIIPSGLPDVDFLEEPATFFATHPVIPESEREVPEIEPEVLETAGIEPNIMIEGELPEADYQQQTLDLVPANMPDSVSEPPLDRTAPAARDTDVLPSPRPDTERRSPFDDRESPLVLEPIVVTDSRGRRRRRRRHLIIDQETKLSREELMRNFDTANTHLIRPFDIARLRDSAETLLSKFGSREAAHGNKRFWRNPKTLPEPDDPSPFCIFTEEEPREPEFPVPRDLIPEGVSEYDITGEDLQRRSREEPRAEEMQDDTHGLSTASSKTFPSLLRSRTLQDTQDQSAATRSLNVPVISSPDLFRREDIDLFEDILPEPLISEAVTEPPVFIREPEVLLQELPETQERDISTSQRKETCVISPEKTPPPASPEEPSSPLAEHAMTYIRECFEDSDVSNLITFTSVISKTPGTRKYVAKLFSVLLDLHATSIIFIQQPELDGDILISRGPNFHAF